MSEAPTGFLDAWNRLVGDAPLPARAERRGRPARVPLEQLLPTLTFHVMQEAGTLAEHLRALFATDLAESSWSDRRTRWPWELFAELMRRALRPRAIRRRHREAFWRTWRLVALDGTQFSLTNTPQITAVTAKARTRRGRAAFAKMTTAVLLELGLHNPVAAVIGRHGESEWALALRVLAQLPPRALVLADRLYGCAAFAAAAVAAANRVGSHILLRARPSTKPRLVQHLPDGTRLIRAPVRGPRGRGRIQHWVELRELHVRVARPGGPAHTLRLWTSLLDPDTAPALELARVYAQRWEQELFFRDLKRQLRKTDVLQSHTVETAAQELAAMILASTLLATERARAATGAVPVLRVSFVKVLALVQPLWLMLGIFGDVVSERQKIAMINRVYASLRRCLSAPRRPRTCPRAVRQPTRAWPRLIHTHAAQGPWQFELVR